MRIIGYIRCSTSEQADSGAGLQAQRHALQQAATQRGYELTIIEDAGASGKTLTRPGLTEALTRIESGLADGIMVAKLDRLSRSVIDFGNLVARAERNGWNIIALDFGIDLSTPSGKLIANVLMSVAQWEREAIGQRTRDALAVRKAQGVTLGRPPVLSDEVRERVRLMRVEERLSFARIAERLTEERVPTAHGGQWRASTVAGMVR